MANDLPRPFGNYYREMVNAALEQRGIRMPDPYTEAKAHERWMEHYNRLVNPLARDYYAGKIDSQDLNGTIEYVVGELDRDR